MVLREGGYKSGGYLEWAGSAAGWVKRRGSKIARVRYSLGIGSAPAWRYWKSVFFGESKKILGESDTIRKWGVGLDEI